MVYAPTSQMRFSSSSLHLNEPRYSSGRYSYCMETSCIVLPDRKWHRHNGRPCCCPTCIHRIVSVYSGWPYRLSAPALPAICPTVALDAVDKEFTCSNVHVVCSYFCLLYTSYEAINKGIRAATGDIIGLIHSDDFLFSSHTISDIVKTFEEQDADMVYGLSLIHI